MSSNENDDPAQIGMRIRGANGQTANLFVAETYDGADKFVVDKDGSVTALTMSTALGAGLNASFIIFKTGATYYAKNGTTGAIAYSGADAPTVINAALTSLASGGKLHFQIGNFAIPTAIHPPEDIDYVLEGEGDATILTNTSGAGAATISLTYPGESSGLIQILNMRFVGNATGGGPAISGRLNYNTIVDGCTFKDHVDEAGLKLDWGTYYWRVTNCYFINNRYGIQALDTITNTTSCNALMIGGCRFSANLYRDFDNKYGLCVEMVNCVLEGASNGVDLYGSIYCETADSCNFTHLYTEGTHGKFIHLKDSDYCTVNDIQSSVEAGGYGVYLEDSKQCTIEGVHMGFCDFVVYLHNSTNNKISGCTSITNSNHLIGLDATSNYNAISDCVATNPLYLTAYQIEGRYNTISNCIGVELQHIAFSSTQAAPGPTYTYNKFVGCTVHNASKGFVGLLPAFYLQFVAGNIIESCTAVDSGATTKSGIELLGCDYNSIKNNVLVGGVSGTIVTPGTHDQITGNIGYVTEANVLSADFAIDEVAVVMVTTAHGLSRTPATDDVAVTVVESTNVDDWAYGYVKVESIGATNVVCKVSVTTASATGGAKAKLAIKVDVR